jgi:hypothetical protein
MTHNQHNDQQANTRDRHLPQHPQDKRGVFDLGGVGGVVGHDTHQAGHQDQRHLDHQLQPLTTPHTNSTTLATGIGTDSWRSGVGPNGPTRETNQQDATFS